MNKATIEEIDYIPNFNEYSIYILPSDRLESDEVGSKISSINQNSSALILETYIKITGMHLEFISILINT